VLKALNGEGDADDNGIVSFNELIDYVRTEVPRNTRKKQHPRDFGTLDTALPASDISKDGIELARFPALYDFRNGGPLYVASAAPPQVSAGGEEELRGFTEALEAGRLLPADAYNAFDALARLRGQVTEEQYRVQQNRLRVALEDKAQQTLLTYLEGDEVPQTKDEFALAAAYTDAARRLTPESVFLDGRESFFSGRAKLFDRQWAEAADELERAVRVDRGGAYAYNALGISYLEQAEFPRAIPAFRDASRLAVHWVYPLHNLALAHVETGQYTEAIETYRKAIQLKPSYSYLPYNLGLIYQRLNRRKDAEASYRQAINLAPASPEPYNALGAWYAARGRTGDAEKMYRTALRKAPEMLAARHNLAVLLSDQNGRFNEAEQLWRANLTTAPDYLASRLGLAEGLAANGNTGEAIEQYEAAIRERPDYPAARAALADLLGKSGEKDRALAEYRKILELDPNSIAAHEGIGDLEAARGNRPEARAAYEQALERNPDRQTTKRLKGKLKKVRGGG
jgi:superkiller protein 3